ncbi:hypothetical protein H0H93_007097 [Arthromyces matolae]|nr:hypothetical protein H0H93_007097 [Arthromyces matolae]
MSFRIIQPASLRGTSYLCDVLSLTSEELRPVYDILESSEIQKVVFDGRMDFSCLLHYHGVRLQNIIDLQLADIESRARRGERFNGQISRFPKFVSRFDIKVNPGKYRAIHKLSGLTQCAAEHKLIPKNVTKKNSKHLLNVRLPTVNAVDHQMWMNRPFKHTHLEYAAYDVELIEMTYTKQSALRWDL